MSNLLTYRAACYFMEKQALNVMGTLRQGRQAVQNFAQPVIDSVSHGAAGHALLGAGGGGATGGALGAGVGAVVGGVHGYQKARAEGQDGTGAALGAVGGAMNGAGTGAMVGGGLGAVGGGVAAGMRPGLLKADPKSWIGMPSRMGQRFVHSVTGAGAGMKEHLGDIGTLQSRGSYQDAMVAAQAKLDRLRGGDLDKGWLWNTPAHKQIQNATNAFGNTVLAHHATKQIEEMGGTHLPGVLNALATKPGEYISNVARQEWHSTPRSAAGLAMRVGMPAWGVGSALMGPNFRDQQTNPETGEVTTRNPSMVRRGIRAGVQAAGFLAPGMSNLAQATTFYPGLEHAGEGLANLVRA